MTVKYCIWMPFDLQLEPYDARGWRYDRTLGNPMWWGRRAVVMRDYTVPGLLNLADQDFELFVPFFPEHVESGEAKPILRVLQDVPNRVIVSEPVMDKSERGFLMSGTHLWSMAQRYQDADWVVMLWLDSDDIYHRDVWEHVKAVEPREGLAIGFEDAYTYDTRDGTLYKWLGGPEGPPPFFGYCWPHDALQSYDALKGYARSQQFTCVHHKLNTCHHKVWLPEGLFCNTMNGTNCTKDIHFRRNHVIQEHLLGTVRWPFKRRILSNFGIDA